MVVASPRLEDALKQLPIESIESLGREAESKARYWRVRSQACELTLQLEAKPPGCNRN